MFVPQTYHDNTIDYHRITSHLILVCQLWPYNSDIDLMSAARTCCEQVDVIDISLIRSYKHLLIPIECDLNLLELL